MFGFGRAKTSLLAPLAGTIIPIDQVDDPVFSQKMLGDGFAIRPAETGPVEVCAPVAGTIATMFKTLHAFAIVTDDGLEVLVHIGLDTVKLQGEGFTAHAAKGDTVTAGQKVVTVDTDAVAAAGYDPSPLVVLTNRKQYESVSVKTGPTTSGALAAKVVRT